MDFGDAIRALKDGKRVSRSGWNGKGMWLSLVKGFPPCMAEWGPNIAAYMKTHEGPVQMEPTIAMKTADGKIVLGWLASQTDMMADDWDVVK